MRGRKDPAMLHMLEMPAHNAIMMHWGSTRASTAWRQTNLLERRPVRLVRRRSTAMNLSRSSKKYAVVGSEGKKNHTATDQMTVKPPQIRKTIFHWLTSVLVVPTPYERRPPTMAAKPTKPYQDLHKMLDYHSFIVLLVIVRSYSNWRPDSNTNRERGCC